MPAIAKMIVWTAVTKPIGLVEGLPESERMASPQESAPFRLTAEKNHAERSTSPAGLTPFRVSRYQMIGVVRRAA